ncbi:hypothetical protein RSAG8_05759, partial [Rhizoctonia solani AG-8 WAC10335]
MSMVQTPFSTYQLVEQLPSNTERYDDATSVSSTATVIPSGLLDQQK